MSLSRFRHLEEARPEKDESPAGSNQARIAGVGGDAPEPGNVPHQTLAQTSSLELETQHDTLPFLRCARCEGDNNVQVRLCSFCGNNLRTEQQQLYNAQLWKVRQSEAREEQTGLDRLHAKQLATTAPPRAYGEALAASVAEQTRHRNGWEGEQPVFSPALWLLRRIESPAVRGGVIVGCLLTPAAIIAASRSGSNAQLLGVAMAAGLVSICLPTGLFRRRRRWFDDD
jgi:hypothetical protein